MLYFSIECWMMIVRLAWVWGWLLTVCLANTHICPKVQQVEERVAVPHQEPVTFRSYTWCLKVPPRCSKYTVVMRERVTYKTEVRNKTVIECCPGYVWLYKVCVPACPTCSNMQCDKSSNCSCIPGFVGPTCNQTCEMGRWGPSCSEVCVCHVGQHCDPTTGSCSLSTSTSTAKPKYTTILPRTSHTDGQTQSMVTKTTPNSFIDLTKSAPTSSTEDLSDFILRKKLNDSVTLNIDVDENVLINALDEDYPIQPTENTFDSINFISPESEQKKIVENSVSVNSSVLNDRWISELSTHSGITLGSVLGLIALIIVTISVLVRCQMNKKVTEQVLSPTDKHSLQLIARNNHYAVPGLPTFSFVNGYLQDGLEKEMEEDSYDHPKSIRCLYTNEPVYDELKY